MLPYWTRVEMTLQAFADAQAKNGATIPANIASFANDYRVEAVTCEDGCFILELAEGFEFGGASMIMVEVCDDAARYLAADLAEVVAD